MRTDARASERGFTILEVMVAIVLTSIALFGVSGAVLGALHARTDNDLKTALDDDALAALSDVRMMTAYDQAMLAKLLLKSATMQRPLPSGLTETISLSIGLAPARLGNGVTLPQQEVATAVASAGTQRASETIALYRHAPAPGSVVDQ